MKTFIKDLLFIILSTLLWLFVIFPTVPEGLSGWPDYAASFVLLIFVLAIAFATARVLRFLFLTIKKRAKQ